MRQAGLPVVKTLDPAGTGKSHILNAVGIWAVRFRAAGWGPIMHKFSAARIHSRLAR